LNFAADFALHQDAAYDGVTAAMALLNVAAATPLLYEELQISRAAESLGVERATVSEGARIGDDIDRITFADRASGFEPYIGRGLFTEESNAAGELRDRMWSAFDNLALWGGRARLLARAGNIFSTIGSYGARITSGTLYGCCWKGW
jgi:hypothetical protein